MPTMLSQRLRQLRKERSLTLQEVADHLGVTRASASKWETGLNHPSFKRLEALAKLYGVSTPELLSAPASTTSAPTPQDASPHTLPLTSPTSPASPINPTPSSVSRNLPVVYLDYTTPIEALLGRASKHAGFPSRLPVSSGAFFVAMGGYMTAHFGLEGVPREALLLVDPALEPNHGDVVLARTKGLDYQVVAARSGKGGELEFVSLGIKLSLNGPLPGVQPIGVVVEAVSSVPMLGFALNQRTFTLA